MIHLLGTEGRRCLHCYNQTSVREDFLVEECPDTSSCRLNKCAVLGDSWQAGEVVMC